MFSNHNRYITDENCGGTSPDGLYRDLRLEPIHFWIGKGTSRDLCEPHIHDCMQLWYIINDSCIQNFNGTSFVQKRGDFLIVPPFFPHNIDTRNSQNIQFITCEFSEGFITDLLINDKANLFFNFMYLKPLLANAALMHPFLTFDEETTLRIESLLSELLTEYQTISEFSLSYIRMTLIKLLTLLVDEYEKISPAEDARLYTKYRTSIQTAQDFIDEHYTKNIRLKDICKIAMMSVTSFSCVFKQITGKTFTEYLNYLRVCHARRLLVETDLPMIEICLECGFCDTAYFSRIFKRMTGTTPGLFRKENKEK